MRLPRPIKNFEKDFAGCQTTMRRQRGEFNCLPVELEGGATPGWWTSFLFCLGPRSIHAGWTGFPAGCGFFISAAKGQAGKWEFED